VVTFVFLVIAIMCHTASVIRNRWIFLILISVLLLQGCYEKEGGISELNCNLKPESGHVSPKAGKFRLDISTDVQWSIREDADWVDVNPAFGDGDATVWISVDANDGDERSADIDISTLYYSYTQNIRQARTSGDNQNGDKDDSNGNTGAGDVSERIEVPMLNISEDDQFIVHTTEYDGKLVANYSMEYVHSMQHARWVAFAYYHETAAVNTTRTDDFDDDPRVPLQYRAQRNDYPYPPYDRGHLVASSDRVYSEEANEQTFYYSNISPQYSSFNRHIWTKFEETVRNWGRDDSFRDTLYVVKGGTIDNGKIIEYTQPNSIVPVPKYYYMALVNYKDHQYQGIAFWIEHRNDYTASNISTGNHAISIDKLESLTGLDFFPNLPDSVEDKVEANLDKSLWNGI
jgi:endonuclease G